MQQEEPQSLSSPQEIPLPSKRIGDNKLRQRQKDNQKNQLSQKSNGNNSIEASHLNRSNLRNTKTKVQKVQQLNQPISIELEVNFENQAKIFHDHLQETIILIMMDEQPQLVQSQLIDIRNFQITKINHKEIMAFMLVQKTNFIIKKLKSSHYKNTLQIHIESMEKVQKKLLQVFKKGIRQFKHIEQYYDYH